MTPALSNALSVVFGFALLLGGAAGASASFGGPDVAGEFAGVFDNQDVGEDGHGDECVVASPSPTPDGTPSASPSPSPDPLGTPTATPEEFEDADAGHGNDPDHDDEDNPGRGGGNHGADGDD